MSAWWRSIDALHAAQREPFPWATYILGGLIVAEVLLYLWLTYKGDDMRAYRVASLTATVLLAGVVMVLAGCATPITSSKGTAGIPISASGTVGKDLLAAAYNLDNAIAIGVLPAEDPAAGCIHGVLKQAGLEVPADAPAVKSFVPKNDGAASVGSIAYIRAQQLRGLKGLDVPLDCKALIGTLVVDGLSDANKAIIPTLLLK